jgi:hypothetical protein
MSSSSETKVRHPEAAPAFSDPFALRSAIASLTGATALSGFPSTASIFMNQYGIAAGRLVGGRTCSDPRDRKADQHGKPPVLQPDKQASPWVCGAAEIAKGEWMLI